MTEPKREIRCGRAAWEVMRAGVTGTSDLGTADPLFGWPVHVDPEMNDGVWEMSVGGEVEYSGDMTPGHRRSIFIRGVGLFGLSDEVAEQVWANVDRAREGRLADGWEIDPVTASVTTAAHRAGSGYRPNGSVA